MPDDLGSLRTRYAFQDVVTFGSYASGLVQANIAAPEGSALLFLQGGHVTDFEPGRLGPVLFTSAHSHFAPGTAIRGGVPIIFPWFGPHPTRTDLPAHGFARTLPWHLATVLPPSGGGAGVTLTLESSDETRRLWPHDFALRYTVLVGRTLDLSLEVHNTGDAPFTFEEALHTYLSVADVRQVRVEGLDGRDYLDKVDGGRRKTQSGPITLTGETDRVYLNTPDTVTVHDPAACRRIVVSKESSATTVVWNPWVDKAKRLTDFGDDEWPRMICIETANAAENAVILPPGGRHTMRAAVEVA
jgi:glucose-6-phosphate 1-epimerase